MIWQIKSIGFNRKEVSELGNRFLLGNGYMGMRGTLDEARKEDFCAITLAGIYDQVGDGWREPLNAPNPLLTQFSVEGQRLNVFEATEDKSAASSTIPSGFQLKHHELSLDFKYGNLHRVSLWEKEEHRIKIESERFVSMDQAHVMVSTYTLESNLDIRIEILSEIDSDVWDIHGPHYSDFTYINDTQKHLLHCLAHVQNSEKKVAVVRKNVFAEGVPSAVCQSSPMKDRSFFIDLKANVPFKFSALGVIYTTNDAYEPMREAAQLADQITSIASLVKKHQNAWDKIWKISVVNIEGDEEAEMAVNYSLYQLNIAAPRHRKDLSIPARALSGQTYKGAIFWDTEMFMLDYFLYTQPEVAKTLLNYRIQTLEGALKKAEAYGFEGAFYAWESQENGYDACSDYNVVDVFTERPVRTYFKDKQVHISAAIVWGLMKYYEYTDDLSILLDGGATVIIECAKFYRSIMMNPLHRQRYEIHDVIGPDEYHERVHNNAYTNYMAKFSIDAAIQVSELMEPLGRKFLDETLKLQLEEASRRLYLPTANEKGLIEQFDGYFKLEDTTPERIAHRLKHPREYWGGAHGIASDTQVIKQADVITLLEMFHDRFDVEILRKNWMYYEPRTEHGSSLSACMYALVACRFGQPEMAYPLFMKSATSDLRGGGKQWAGLIYIGGTHPAASGGAYKNLIQGFAGVSVTKRGINISPVMPKPWRSLKFAMMHKGKQLNIQIRQNQGKTEVKVDVES